MAAMTGLGESSISRSRGAAARISSSEFGEFLDVCTGDEGLTTANQHHAFHVIVVGDAIECFGDTFGHHRA
jgi:hypothetical protein